MVARSLCLFASEDLTKIPQKFRQKHIATRLTEISPFPKTGFYVAWFGQTAAIWFWDEANVERRLSEMDVSVNQYFPEPVFYDKSSDSTFLGSCVEGVEKQTWDKEGALVKSIWLPSTQNLQAAEITNRVTQSRPFQTKLEHFGGESNKVLVYWVVSFLFLVWAAALVGKFAGIVWQQYDTESQVLALQTSSENALTQRNAAIDAGSKLKTIAEFIEKRDSYAFFAVVGSVLEELNASIVLYNLEGDSLRLVISSEVTDPILFVQQLQALDEVASVQISKSGQNQQTELVIIRQ